MSNRRNGPVKRAAIRLIAAERRIPLGAAAYRHAMTPAGAKVALCARVQRRLEVEANVQTGTSGRKSKGGACRN